MPLIYLALGILSFVGAGAIIAWVRKPDQHATFGVVVFALVLGFTGLLLTVMALDSL